MSKKVTMTEEEFERRLDESYKVGISVGLDDAAHNVMEQAMMYFGIKQDEKANLLRTIAAELKTKAKDAHPIKS